MRVLLQRVSSASVSVDNHEVSRIGRGLLALVGVHREDTVEDAAFVTRKMLSLRLWPDEAGLGWKRSVVDIGGEVMLVSQFTLYGRVKNGAKPDFHLAMPPDSASAFYSSYVEQVRSAYRADLVKDGVFGAMMEVGSVNDGPVTVTIDSRMDGDGWAAGSKPPPIVKEKGKRT